eukprot:COSAG05_NODE_6714_length_916_cov_1.632803_1_plen_105_part_00
MEDTQKKMAETQSVAAPIEGPLTPLHGVFGHPIYPLSSLVVKVPKYADTLASRVRHGETEPVGGIGDDPHLRREPCHCLGPRVRVRVRKNLNTLVAWRDIGCRV